jgi:hypothetical protein
MIPLQDTRALDLQVTPELQVAFKLNLTVEIRVGMSNKATLRPSHSSSPKPQWMYRIQEALPWRSQDLARRLLTDPTNKWVPT